VFATRAFAIYQRLISAALRRSDQAAHQLDESSARSPACRRIELRLHASRRLRLKLYVFMAASAARRP
jgi:hypothetical protein